MSKGRWSRLSREDTAYVQELRDRAINMLVSKRIGHPEPNREIDIEEILTCFIVLNRPSFGARELARVIDFGIALKLEQGMPLNEAVRYWRQVYTKTLNKTPAAVKAAHLRYGTVGVTKKPKV